MRRDGRFGFALCATPYAGVNRRLRR